jgi:hypothetical protein
VGRESFGRLPILNLEAYVGVEGVRHVFVAIVAARAKQSVRPLAAVVQT